MKRFLAMLLVLVLVCGGMAAADGEQYISYDAYGDANLVSVQPIGWSTQLENEQVDRMLDANRYTVYEHTCWQSKTNDDIPDITLFFNRATISDIWIRNGDHSGEENYSTYARIDLVDVLITTMDGAQYSFPQNRVADRYSGTQGWIGEWQQLLQLPAAYTDVVQVDLFLRGWRNGYGDDKYIAHISDISFVPTPLSEATPVTPVPWVQPTATPWQQPTANPWQPTYNPWQPTPTPDPWQQYQDPYATPNPWQNDYSYPLPENGSAWSDYSQPVFSQATPAVESAALDTYVNQAITGRSGPGYAYTELGTFLSRGTAVRAISMHYSDEDQIWWVQLEFDWGNEKRRVYTEVTRTYLSAGQGTVETMLSDAILSRSVFGYWGPGYAYSLIEKRIPEGTSGSVWMEEGMYALFEFQDPDTGMLRRVWVPKNALEAMNG